MSPLQTPITTRGVAVGPDGFEPSPPVPKTGVLPLDDGPISQYVHGSCVVFHGRAPLFWAHPGHIIRSPGP